MNRLLMALVAVAITVPAFAQIYHGSARVITTVGSLRANDVYLFDSTGTLTGSYAQIGTARDDAWGYRDGASNGTQVFFGWAGGVARHDADGSNGTMLFANASGLTTIRALAYDPTGNGGAGSLWTADFGSALVELSMTGTVLTTFANTPGWSLYGLAYDDSDGNLFGHHTGGEVVKINTTTGTMSSVFTSGFPNLAAQGGLSGYSELGGNLAAISQGTPDELGVYNSSGSLVLGPIDIEAQSGSNGHLGVAVAVPEPASMIALGLGAAALLRRRSKKAA